MTENKQCQNCKNPFTIEPDDFAFYEKIKVPAPTWCPECRLIRRFVWRNERALYKRMCDLCGESKILMYPSDSQYKVYCYECWWSDRWSGLDYGRGYDFSKPFFEQFQELLAAAPRVGIIKQGFNTESEYTNRVSDMRNCYLVYGTSSAEYCRYGVWLNFSKECIDSYNVQKSERCYECLDCFQCYNLAFSQESNNCADSWLLFNCVNCQNCFGCVNLRNKSYCIWNKQYEKDDYRKIIAGLSFGSKAFIAGMQTRFDEFQKKFVVPAFIAHHSTNSTGNWIENSKNIFKSFTVANVEEGRYLYAVFGAKDVMDYSYWGAAAEQIYEKINGGIQIANIQFANECWNNARDMRYVTNCHNSHDLFGSAGLRNTEYCILNKKYSKSEYEDLVSRIIAHMNETPYIDKQGRVYRYGEFFPPELSPFAYNETIAQEYFPLNKKTAVAQGYDWRDLDPKNYQISFDVMRLPDHIRDVSDNITEEIIGCEHEGRCAERCATAFRITPEDLMFYRRAQLPLPRLCPNCRHFERLRRRAPIKLWSRNCQCAGKESESGVYQNQGMPHSSHSANEQCPNKFETIYAPDKSDIVYCRQCYNSETA